jgi:hypothetical protein
MRALSFLDFHSALEGEAGREFLRFGADDLPLTLCAEVPAGNIGRLRRYDIAGLDPLGKAALATDCALLVGRVGAHKAGLVIPVIAEGEYLLTVAVADGQALATLAAVEREPVALGPWSSPALDCQGLFRDGLDAGLRGRRCPDCAAGVGSRHHQGCDVARCSDCRGQHLVCGCPAEAEPWAGEWPGVYECRELGFYARRSERGWERCEPETPGAREDLNRLAEYWAAASASTSAALAAARSTKSSTANGESYAISP